MSKSTCQQKCHDSGARQLLGTDIASTSRLAWPADDEDGQDNKGFATCFHFLCLRVFQHLCKQEQDSSRQPKLKEELGRLFLWGESFGPGEIDKTLKQSNDLRTSVLELLCDIGRLLLRVTSWQQPETAHSHKQSKELRSFVRQAKVIISSQDDQLLRERDGDGDDGCDNNDTNDEPSETEVDDIFDEVGFLIQCLMDLGPTIEQTLVFTEKPRRQNPSSESFTFSVSGPAKVYVSLVREKYRQAQTQLVERLGEANWQRHLTLRKWMEATDRGTGGCATVRSEDFFHAQSAFHDSGIGTSVPTQSQYAAASHASFISSSAREKRRSVRVPPTPREVSEGKPFQCHICGNLLSQIKNRVDWKMHVFADLKPYICTFTGCTENLRQFTSRDSWADHELSEHRVRDSWSCPECIEEYISFSDWETHLRQAHARTFSGSKLLVAKTMAYRRQARPSEEEECPLCCIMLGKPRRAFIQHVGQHMEEIALMALPCQDDQDLDNAGQPQHSTLTSDLFQTEQAPIHNSLPPEKFIASSHSLGTTDTLSQRQQKFERRSLPSTPDIFSAEFDPFSGFCTSPSRLQPHPLDYLSAPPLVYLSTPPISAAISENSEERELITVTLSQEKQDLKQNPLPPSMLPRQSQDSGPIKILGTEFKPLSGYLTPPFTSTDSITDPPPPKKQDLTNPLPPQMRTG